MSLEWLIKEHVVQAHDLFLMYVVLKILRTNTHQHECIGCPLKMGD